MGTTNLLIGLKSKFASVSGDVRDLDARISHIKAEYERLPELEEHYDKLVAGVDHITAVIQMIEEDWDPASVKPVKRYSRRLPMKLGDCTATAIDILKANGGWYSCRELAKLVLHHFGHPNPEREVLRRATNAIDASFRTRQDRTLVCDDSWPRRWHIDRGLGRPTAEARAATRLVAANS